MSFWILPGSQKHETASSGLVIPLIGVVATSVVGVISLPSAAYSQDINGSGEGYVADGMSRDVVVKWWWDSPYSLVDAITGQPIRWLSPDQWEKRVRAAQRAADVEALRKVKEQLAPERARQRSQQVRTGSDSKVAGVGTPGIKTINPITSPWQKWGTQNVPNHSTQSSELIGARLAKAFPVDVQGITGVEYSKNGWLILNVGTQITPDKRKSFVLLGKIGEDHKQALATAGIKLGKNQEIIFKGSYLSQESVDAETASKFTADEWSVAVALRIGTSNKYFKIIVPELSASQSGDHDNIKSWDSSVASVTETRTYGNERNFVGERRISAGMGVTMDVGESWELTFSPKITHRVFNDGSEGGFYMGGGVDYARYLGEWGKFGLGGDYIIDRANVRASYSVLIPGTTVSAEPAAFYSMGGNLPVNYGWGLHFKLPLGGGVPERSFDRPLPGASMDIKADTFRAAQAFASETREVKGKTVTVTVLKSVVSNAPGAVGTLTITNDGWWSTTDGEMNANPNTTYNATANTDHYEVRVNNGAWVNIGNVTSFRPGVTAGVAALADGTHTIEVRSVSASGLTSTASSITVKIDTVAPSATGFSFPNLDTAGGGFSGTISWDSAVRSQSVTVSNGGTGSITGGDDTATHTITGTAGTDPGWVKEKVIDKAGNVGEKQTDDQVLF